MADFPIALTIAGSDSSGGAGVQADLKTFSALKVYGASVITALTAQNTLGVTAIHNPPPEFTQAQMDAVFSDLDVRAVKIGMLSVPETIHAVADGLVRFGQTRIVLDPVMVAASGARLLVPEAVEAIKTRLMPLAMVITPNLPEAAALLGGDLAVDVPSMQRQGEALLKLGAQAVLIKGGHGTGIESLDVLVMRDEVHTFAAKRLDVRGTHGTGCTLSSAVAAGLAHGLDLRDAVAQAKTYLTAALAASEQLCVGSGHGPVHHFHGMW
jgi:hydroxymethylpyrimidine/phosphomethylpyrimidine kinase